MFAKKKILEGPICISNDLAQKAKIKYNKENEYVDNLKDKMKEETGEIYMYNDEKEHSVNDNELNSHYGLLVKREPDLDMGIDFLGAHTSFLSEQYIKTAERLIKLNKNQKKIPQIKKTIYICNWCDYKSNIRCNFRRHVFRHAGIKPFNCTVCKFSSAEKSDFTRHLQIHVGDLKPYKCNVCDYETRRKYALNRHKLNHANVPERQLNKKLKRHSCTTCNYSGHSFSDLKRHKFTHGGIKPFACTLCEYRAVTSGDLRKHFLIHTGDKPYACDECNYRARRSGHLKIHKERHAKKNAIP